MAEGFSSANTNFAKTLYGVEVFPISVCGGCQARSKARGSGAQFAKSPRLLGVRGFKSHPPHCNVGDRS